MQPPADIRPTPSLEAASMSLSDLRVWPLLCGLIVPATTQGGDWPQILGPNRTGVAAADEKLAETWPASGPAVTWEREVGSGYAGIAVSGPRAFLFHRVGDQDVLEAIDPRTGKPLWKEGDPTTFTPGVGGGDGPLCVPTVSNGLVVTYSPQGLLVVRNAATGKLQWKSATHREFNAQEGYFGAGNSPLVVGDVVVVNVGGAKNGAGIVGFNLQTGAPVWKQLNDQASYSAPIMHRQGNRELVVVITRLKCVALDPVKGEIVWEVPFGQRGPTVNGALPVPVKGRLFLTASYGIGGVLLEPQADSADVLWADTETLASQYATPIESDGLLSGSHARAAIPPLLAAASSAIRIEPSWV